MHYAEDAISAVVDNAKLEGISINEAFYLLDVDDDARGVDEGDAFFNVYFLTIYLAFRLLIIPFGQTFHLQY